MNQRQINPSAFFLVYVFTLVPNGNAAFGDYLKKRSSINLNYTTIARVKIPSHTHNAARQTDSTHRESEITPRHKNFNVHEVRLYKNNPTPMFPDREKKMMEALFSGVTISPGQAFDFRKQIYGAELEKEFDSFLEQTSPNWDRLEALLRKAEKITRLPQSMYDEEEAKFSQPKVQKTRSDMTTGLGDVFKQRLQKIGQNDKLPDSLDDLSMNFAGGRQIYPFEPDLSFPRIIRGKREIPRNYFPTFPSTERTINVQLLREAQEQYFRGPPPIMPNQFAGPNRIATNLNNFRPKNEFVRNPPYHQNAKNDFMRIDQNKITFEITRQTPHGTMDSTWKNLIKQMNPIQQKIIEDLFLYGPPTSTALRSNSPIVQTSNTIKKQHQNNALFTRSLPSKTNSFAIRNFRIREIIRTSRPRIQTPSEKIRYYRQSQIRPQGTISPTLRTPTIDRNLVKEWLRSLNPQDQKEIENMFFNGQSSPLYDINNIESIKNAFKNECLKEARNINGQSATNNLKSTFISRNNKRKFTEDPGFYNNYYEDVSRRLKQAPQHKLKIVDDWCGEIERDLHRRFPTATMKAGETRGPRPLYATRYYPWELFSMLPPEQN